MTTILLSNLLSNLSFEKYNEYTKKINEMCIKSAEKGNVYLVLTKKEFDEIDFPINKYNFKLLKTFLQEEGLLISIQETTMEIFWIDLVASLKVGKIDNEMFIKFPAISDNEVKKLLRGEIEDKVRTESDGETEIDSDGDSEIESDDNIFDIEIDSEITSKITNMVNYVKTMVNQANNSKKYKEKERIVYTMFLTILKIENDEPIKNKNLFKNINFIDNLIKKLDEVMEKGKMNWPIEMKKEFEQIKKNRFPLLVDS